jgi:hypothetical protein
LKPQKIIRNFKKASHELKIIFLFSLKTGKSFFPLVKKTLTGLNTLFGQNVLGCKLWIVVSNKVVQWLNNKILIFFPILKPFCNL